MEQLVTLEEAADRLKVAKQTLYNWVSQGKIQCVKLGGLKFTQEQLDELIEQSKINNGVHH